MRRLTTAAVTVTLMMWSSARATTINVTNANDNGDGSLRAALASAADGDTINFSVSLPATVTLTSGELRVTNSVDIIGPVSGNLEINGNGISRVFKIAPSNTVSIASLTVNNGSVTNSYPDDSGGGIYNDNSALTVSNCAITGNSANFGGGIFNSGSFDHNARLSIVCSTFRDNSAESGGGAIFNDGGNDRGASLSTASSTFSGNSAWVGGGIFNAGGYAGSATMTVTNSTFSGNLAEGYGGGGIFNDARGGGSALLTVANSTFSGNSANYTSGGCIALDGGIGGSAVLMIGNTILSAGASGGTMSNDSGTVTSLGYNLSNDGNGPNDGITDLLNTNPILGPLADNGGPTKTHALLPGSPAIDAGDSGFTPPPDFDQRGPAFLRVVGSRIDIGAFEAQTPCPDVTGSWSNLVQTCKTEKDGVHCKVKGKLIVQNIGTVDAQTSFVRYFLSSDDQFDTGDLRLKQQATGKIKPGKSKKRTFVAKLPTGISASGEFIIAVIDADNTDAECNEDNNIILSGPMP